MSHLCPTYLFESSMSQQVTSCRRQISPDQVVLNISQFWQSTVELLRTTRPNKQYRCLPFVKLLVDRKSSVWWFAAPRSGILMVKAVQRAQVSMFPGESCSELKEPQSSTVSSHTYTRLYILNLLGGNLHAPDIIHKYAHSGPTSQTGNFFSSSSSSFLFFFFSQNAEASGSGSVLP